MKVVILRVAEDLLVAYAATMAKEHHYCVYILSSRSRTLYVGVTNNLIARLLEHRDGEDGSFTKRYAIHRLVYYERFKYVNNAIAREKVVKHCARAEKLALITAANPTWEDLGAAMLEWLARGMTFDAGRVVTFSDERTADPPPLAKDDKV